MPAYLPVCPPPSPPSKENDGCHRADIAFAEDVTHDHAVAAGEVSDRRIEPGAGPAACHGTAPAWADTDWDRIIGL